MRGVMHQVGLCVWLRVIEGEAAPPNIRAMSGAIWIRQGWSLAMPPTRRMVSHRQSHGIRALLLSHFVCVAAPLVWVAQQG